MIIKIGKHNVDVSDRECSKVKCFQLGQDKGSFTPGRGYTSYHKKPRWVCMTRHVHGCPTAGVCLDCRTIVNPANLKIPCRWCGSENIEIRDDSYSSQNEKQSAHSVKSERWGR
jgi:hypothetical protein